MGCLQTNRQWLNTSVVEVPRKTESFQPHNGLTGPGVLCWKEETSQSGSENQRGLCLPILVKQKVAEHSDGLLKSPHADSLTCKHSPSLLCRSGNLRGTRDILEKIEWIWGEGCGYRSHCPCVEPGTHVDYRRAPSFLCCTLPHRAKSGNTLVLTHHVGDTLSPCPTLLVLH